MGFGFPQTLVRAGGPFHGEDRPTSPVVPHLFFYIGSLTAWAGDAHSSHKPERKTLQSPDKNRASKTPSKDFTGSPIKKPSFLIAPLRWGAP